MNEIVTELEKIAADMQTTFGDLSAEQVNWKPSETGWSVGQCFDHLIKTNELFYGKLDEIAVGKQKNSFIENWSPLSSFWAGLLIGSLKKDSRKFKAPSEKIVPPSMVDAEIVERFVSHQSELVGKIERTDSVDWNKVKITSPFMKLMTYRLADGFQVIVEHEKRHFRQAERVTQTDGFPN